ncbi:hypothetical protein Bpfe_009777 [Biomphalaria pfeifferi]|uniref:Uncharacterized protein n=1 Tax=Biomphalaria pfeifferi TaxID=112525 RepID=A0AAD8BVF0_BIOPF|nr:hypothetical protein Bpfe_009777 [Biomphalaria pfeifferi]
MSGETNDYKACSGVSKETNDYKTRSGVFGENNDYKARSVQIDQHLSSTWLYYEGSLGLISFSLANSMSSGSSPQDEMTQAGLRLMEFEENKS